MKITYLTKEVLASFKKAWSFRWPFLIAFLLVRLFVLAIVSPVAGLILSLAIATSDQGALTDQDIAYFILTPVGFVAVLAVLCLLLAGAVLGISLMTNTIRIDQGNKTFALRSSLAFIAANFPRLVLFSLHLIFRVLLIALPFLALAFAVAILLLTKYDINYYLTYWPPAFISAALVIALIVLGLFVILLQRLTGWAIALHLVLFENFKPGNAFQQSAQALIGHKTNLTAKLLIWIAGRMLLGFMIAVMMGVLFNLVPDLIGSDLKSIAIASITLLALWTVFNTVVSALMNGTLADLLYETYLRTSPSSVSTEPVYQEIEPRAQGAGIPTLALAVVGIGVVVFGVIAAGRVLDSVAQDRVVEIIAHRGASASYPENTMAAIIGAVEEDADWVEIDVQETADEVVIVAHDSDFMKLGGVDTKVWDATMPEIAEIDIGSWFDAAFSNERTPTLREALQAVKDRGKMIIELKYYGHDVALEDQVVQIVEELGMVSEVAVMSLKIDGIRKMQTIRPDWRYGILAATAIGDLTSLDADFLAVNTGQVSLPLVRRAHESNKELYVWTVDDPLTMSRMISMGVDGLITNKPLLARKVMEERNGLTTYERLALWLTDRFQIGNFNLVADETDA